jgi:hypothetical protein
MPISWREVQSALEKGDIDALTFTPQQGIARVQELGDPVRARALAKADNSGDALPGIELSEQRHAVTASRHAENQHDVRAAAQQRSKGTKAIRGAPSDGTGFQLGLEADEEFQTFRMRQLPKAKAVEVASADSTLLAEFIGHLPTSISQAWRTVRRSAN